MDQDRTLSFMDGAVSRTVGPYRILRRIGVGGMGEVFLAEDPRLERRLAIKFLSPALCDNEQNCARFLREARLVARLNHPGIVAIYDVGQEQGRPYIAMEYLKGRSLRQVIDTDDLSPEHALRIALDLCHGLAAAHREGIVHRDIKPSNIMIDAFGTVKLLDFGLAASGDSQRLTKENAILGTINYMSPEQARGDAVDTRSDLFSLGIVLYEMLTGSCPFERGYLPASLHAIMYEPARPLDIGRHPSPPGTQTVLDRLLSKETAGRYQDVDQVAADLKRLLQGLPVAATQLKETGGFAATGRIAVLYLRNLGEDSDDYLSYSLTDDIIVALSRIRGFRVAPLRSSLRYKGSDLEIEEIGRRMRAVLVLDGTVHHRGDAVCVSVQLFDLQSDLTVWADRFEVPLDRLPQVKESLCEGICRSLNIDTGDSPSAPKPVPVNPVAYECFLRGKYIFEKKRDTADIETALALLQKAAELDPDLIGARIGIARVYFHRTEYERAHGILVEALTAARALRSVADEAAVLRQISAMSNHTGDYNESITHLTRAIELSRSIDDLHGEAEANSLLLAAYFRLGLYNEGKQLFERTVEIGHQLDDRARTIHALRYMGWLHLQRGHRREAHQMFTTALKLARQVQDRQAEAFAYNDIGMCYQGGAGDVLQTALAYQQKARRLLETLDDRNNLATILGNLGVIYLAQGRFRLALEHAEQAARSKQRSGDRASYTLNQINAAAARLALGHYSHAIETAREAETTAEDIGNKAGVAHSLIVCSLAHYLEEDIPAARDCISRGVLIATENNQMQALSEAYSVWGRIEYHEGRFQDCCRAVAKGIDAARRFMNEQAAACCEAYRTAANVHITGHLDNSVSILDDLIFRLENTLVELSLRRLKCELLLTFGSTESDRQQGRSLLADTRLRAEQLEFASEIVWLRQLEDRPSH